MALALAKKGHQIMFALNLGMAMEFINDIKLDLIIIGAGEIENQLEIVTSLKELLPYIPILTIMGNELKKEKYRKLLYAGVSRLINTPFDIEKIEKMINKTVN
jgi:DNA-binding NtrC family response regulator